MRWLVTIWLCLPLAAHAEGGPARWQPARIGSFDIQLNTPRSIADLPLVDVLELDHDTDPALLAALHARGTRTICYINAGAWESYRSDKTTFPAAVLGKVYDGYPDERWLDIRRIDLLGPIMQARMDQCKAKGFSAVDPDNVNGYENDTGFALTKADQLAYNRWLMQQAHARGLAIVLKNTPELAPTLEAEGYDMALTESCVADDFCEAFRSFTANGKPVISLEYTDEEMDARTACPTLRKLGFYGLIKASSSSIGAARTACD